MSEPKPRPEPVQNNQEGWWFLRDISGSLSRVAMAIESAKDIPDYWKAAIKADLAERCRGDFNFVYLDAHFHLDKKTGNAVLHYHATPDKKLL